MLSVPTANLFNSPKIISLPEATKIIKQTKMQGRTVGLCHGGFDLLHPGHIIHFESAKQLCNVLVISVTSDKYVTERKGSGRPVFSERLRAYNIAALQCVDYVVITDFAKAVPILELLQPSYYIKGPDFIGKTTPGITAERDAIMKVGGEMKYTADPKLSTTEIIEYIKHQLDAPEILVIIDRDGTLIRDDDGFFGRDANWKEELQLNETVVNYLMYLQTKYKTTKIVVSNQAGVARRYFDCARAEEINTHIHSLLAQKGIKIDWWEYCPDVDTAYASLKNEIDFNPRYVKEITKRKPSPEMVFDGLQKLQRNIGEFQNILIIGDKDDDDGELARNLKGKFIDVKGKTYEKLKNEFA